LGVASCRRIWPWLTDERSRLAVEVAERLADGEAGQQEETEAADAAYEAADDAAWHSGDGPPTAAWEAAHDATWRAAHAIDPQALIFADAHFLWEPSRRSDTEADVVAILGDLFGPVPFRALTLDSSCKTPTTLALAQAIYDDRHLPSGYLDPDRLAILADALEDAGCGDAELLTHLRSAGPHVRGCWALDLVLGRS
jgi:hypothetical protein